MLDITHKNVKTHESCRGGITGVDDGDIKKAVINSGARSYVGVVAILGGVAYGHEKGTLGDTLSISGDGVKLGAVFGVGLKCALYICCLL